MRTERGRFEGDNVAMGGLPTIDVYCVAWPDWQQWFADFACLLGRQEMAIAARYRFEKDRVRYVICHGWLRRILGERLRKSPESLEVCLGRHGKPFTAGDWQFNLSYGGDWAIIALAKRMPLGVDLEPLRPFPESLSIARNFFSLDEIDLIERSDESTRSRRFLMLWTRKEAYVKAVGQGLTAPLDNFSAGLDAPWIYDANGCPWRLVNLPCLVTHAAALCAPGCWQWRQHPLAL